MKSGPDLHLTCQKLALQLGPPSLRAPSEFAQNTHVRHYHKRTITRCFRIPGACPGRRSWLWPVWRRVDVACCCCCCCCCCRWLVINDVCFAPFSVGKQTNRQTDSHTTWPPEPRAQHSPSSGTKMFKFKQSSADSRRDNCSRVARCLSNWCAGSKFCIRSNCSRAPKLVRGREFVLNSSRVSASLPSSSS